MNSYHLTLTGDIYAETWEDALAEAERLRLTVSLVRENVPDTTPGTRPEAGCRPMAFSGTLNDGRSRPPGIPRTPAEHERVTGGYAKFGPAWS